ncbi:Cw-type zinc-finger protein [Thalictrum thalictroides]|uniref:Cw-type zinc-finger protein n=1 Tax=Thalictrum thalictroides TaxID=46969 RepID=A0A7J6VG36_THATH|nr:Cw-type zinc-finger protein [Thalictrum thalictroides]
MIRFDISEKETTQTLLESYQHLTPDQQHNRLDAHITSSTWPAANDYEICNEMMTVAALAYKCMEVAFMRVVFSKAIHVEKDRRELQMGLQNIHPGESPSSSSGSDVDSLYNQGMLDTGVGSRMRGYHAFVVRNRPNIERVLNVVEDVHIVFKASKKCEKALAAATESCEESKLAAGICLVQRVINFSFHDVDKLIHLVQLAMDAICH